MQQTLEQITAALAIAFWLSIIFTLVIVVFFIIGFIQKIKVQRAVLDIHRMVHDMNERDKSRSNNTAAPPSTPQSDSKYIANQPTTDQSA